MKNLNFLIKIKFFYLPAYLNQPNPENTHYCNPPPLPVKQAHQCENVCEMSTVSCSIENRMAIFDSLTSYYKTGIDARKL